MEMKCVLLVLLALVCISFCAVKSKRHDAVVEDNDFAEFEEFDDDEGNIKLVGCMDIAIIFLLVY